MDSQKELLILSMSEIEPGNALFGFYRALHHYLKQHFKATKTAIGR